MEPQLKVLVRVMVRDGMPVLQRMGKMDTST